MAVPKRKISSARRKQRRQHLGLSTPLLGICPQCKEKKPTHRVCPNCGYYNGKEVIKEKEEVVEEKE